MDYYDAITEVLEKAGRIKLPRHRVDVVTVARREFAKGKGCPAKFIEPIEQVLRECLQEWTVEQKREIWENTETGLASDLPFDDWLIESIDMDLEGELMYHLIERLSPRGDKADGDEYSD